MVVWNAGREERFSRMVWDGFLLRFFDWDYLRRANLLWGGLGVFGVTCVLLEEAFRMMLLGFLDVAASALVRTIFFYVKRSVRIRASTHIAINSYEQY